MRHRLVTGPHASIVEFVSAPGIERDAAYSWPFMMQAHLAHAIMLRLRNVIPPEAAERLTEGLLKLRDDGPGAITMDPTIEDLYFNIETHLKQSIGADAAGWLQTGRSRNDHYACVARLWTRSELKEVLARLQHLRSVLLNVAEQHLGTVMTGYTHQQPAQPITFGHYLLGVEASLQRDHARLQDAWPRVNLSPLGAGSMAGVSWPVDRELLAKLLGFSGMLSNSIDSVATRDFAYEVVGAFAILTVTISRFAADLQQFVTWEFGGMEVSDNVAAISSVMPQKKNPVSLEHCKGAAAHVVSSSMAMLASAKSSPFSHQREVSVESMRPFSDAVFQTRKSLALIEATLDGLLIRPELLEARAALNFSTATDLADLLVQAGGLTFRQAHAVVGSGVREALEAGQGPSWFTPARISGLVKAETGKILEVDAQQLLNTIDPRGSVQSRHVLGGPALQTTTNQHLAATKQLEKDSAWLDDLEADLATANQLLEELSMPAASQQRMERS